MTSVELPVFVESNLGTRLVAGVSPHIVAGDLKGKLEEEHFLCFPYLGEIRVNSLKVKRKSCLYHIPNSMPMLLALQGSEENWFIHMDATTVELHTKNRETGHNQQRAEGAFLCKEELSKHAANASSTSPYCENILTTASGEFDKLVSLASAPVKDGGNTGVKLKFECSPLDESKRGKYWSQHEPAEDPINHSHNFGKKKEMKELNEQNDSQNVARKDFKKGSGSPLSSKQECVAETTAISSYLGVHEEPVAQIDNLIVEPVVKTSLCQHSSDSQLRPAKATEGLSQAVHKFDSRKDKIGGVKGEKSKRDSLCGDAISLHESVFTSGVDVNNWLHEDGNTGKTIPQEEKGTCSSDRISGVGLSDAVSVTGILEQYFSNLDEVNSPVKTQMVLPSGQTRDLKQNFCKKSTRFKRMKKLPWFLRPN